MQATTFIGNLTRDPELRHSKEGKPRATFSVAINEGEGEYEKTHYVNFTAFGTLGENVAKSLAKGMRVVVHGRLDTYVKQVQVDGQDKNLTMTNFIASAVGPDLRWAVADVSKVVRSASNNESSNEAPAAKEEAPKAKSSGRGRAKPAPVEDDDDF